MNAPLPTPPRSSLPDIAPSQSGVVAAGTAVLDLSEDTLLMAEPPCVEEETQMWSPPSNLVLGGFGGTTPDGIASMDDSVPSQRTVAFAPPSQPTLLRPPPLPSDLPPAMPLLASTVPSMTPPAPVVSHLAPPPHPSEPMLAWSPSHTGVSAIASIVPPPPAKPASSLRGVAMVLGVGFAFVLGVAVTLATGYGPNAAASAPPSYREARVLVTRGASLRLRGADEKLEAVATATASASDTDAKKARKPFAPRPPSAPDLRGRDLLGEGLGR